LIRAREARRLFWSLAARLFFVVALAVLSVLHLFRVIGQGTAAESDRVAVRMLLFLIVATALILYFMYLARRQKNVTLAGLGAVALDVGLVSLLPVVWYSNVSLPNGSPTLLLKNELVVICVVFIVINALALRPLYPALAAGGFILLQLGIMAFVLSHPSTVVTTQYVVHYYTDAVHPGVTVLRILFLALVGGFLALLAKTARKTVQDAVDLEVANMEIKERQAEMLLEGRMTALGNLVAGVAHEVNSPLGVLRSGLDTVEKASGRLAELATSSGADSGDTDKILGISRENTTNARVGVERITRIVGSLKDFARLDEAELQHADLREGLESTLALVDRDKMGSVELVKELSDLPPILSRPRELNQVFMTIVVNALEALGGQGVLRVSTACVDDEIRIEFADTGPGIPPEQLETLFELRFAAKGRRMAMGLGLPTARRIVERHGGSLTAESNIGEGATFTVILPVEETPSSSWSG
jgi:signal transduction histidine kinase